MHSSLYSEICQTIAFEDMDDQQADRLIKMLNTHDNAHDNVKILLSNYNRSCTAFGISCTICGRFIPIQRGRPVHDMTICSECIKKLRVLMGIECNCAAEDYTKLRRGDKIYYVDLELGQVEEGIIDSVHFKDGRVDDFSVDFVESKDFDQFYGSALGKRFFLSQANAEKALIEGGDTQNG